jgi:Putative peptidoglycan binding domain/N-acetylmuramoyl-L-alanine amidase
MLLTWAPGVLRAAGLTVVETPGWQSRSHGPFPDSIAGVWHHDGSPAGNAGALGWMIANWNNASANFWVDRDGTWYCVGAGVAWHTGPIVMGTPGNFECFGVETNQTVGETPAPAMLEATRAGFAALFRHMGRNADSLWFHKSIARPPGRKVDPWFGPASNDRANWPGELAVERRNVQQLIDRAGISHIVVPPAPEPAPVGADWLRRGFTGDRVELLQQRLVAWGLLTGKKAVDGAFGPATEGAVRVFQTRHRLPATGIVDPQTWDALHANPVAATPYPGTLLREGSTGPAVRSIQQRLGVAADGQFGPRTKAAVVAFQRSKGLGADGIVGPATWKALFS